MRPVATASKNASEASGTYVNIFDEFCRVFEGPAAAGRPANQATPCCGGSKIWGPSAPAQRILSRI